MTRAGVTRASLSKEVRGQLLLWAACIAALTGALLRPGGLLMSAAVVAYVVGPLAIGAQTVGQEYGYRTMPMLLAQPIDRRRVYALKFLVAAAMMLSVAALASQVFVQEMAAPGMWQRLSVQILPVLGGLLVAPWLTMETRNATAGVLFTASLASITYLGALAGVSFWFDVGERQAQSMILGPWVASLIAFSVVAGWLGARRFTHLEVMDGTPGAIAFPRWSSGRTERTHRPLRALLAKELHLQQLTFVLVAIFTPMSLLLVALQRAIPSWSDAPIPAIVLMYCVCLAIVIGALASADERQYGTLEWQLLQPSPAWRQWTVKVVVAFGLALLFGVALPALLLRFAPGHSPRLQDFAIDVLLLTACSLYVSSLATSGVRAMVLVLPAGFLSAAFIETVERILRWNRLVSSPVISSPQAREAVALLLLLMFGFFNHRAIDRSATRIGVQVVVLALFAFVTVALT